MDGLPRGYSQPSSQYRMGGWQTPCDERRVSQIWVQRPPVNEWLPARRIGLEDRSAFHSTDPPLRDATATGDPIHSCTAGAATHIRRITANVIVVREIWSSISYVICDEAWHIEFVPLIPSIEGTCFWRWCRIGKCNGPQNLDKKRPVL